ncbi:hypothetical protein MAPG_11804 [Magnaporthiopsis poae ATCC 64411]|uniref:Uncharacterized protein n=1 Tax=Magnaporthiopsis poae (strain ATCC 64411 / 73-15) TaxID=644358 RepID=A0A0C4EG81_MAGP6|nr:hypothetical protein MAPG_11804 [Magnaporthiopsis poae ATCC 64411]
MYPYTCASYEVRGISVRVSCRDQGETPASTSFTSPTKKKSTADVSSILDVVGRPGSPSVREAPITVPAFWCAVRLPTSKAVRRLGAGSFLFCRRRRNVHPTPRMMCRALVQPPPLHHRLTRPRHHHHPLDLTCRAFSFPASPPLPPPFLQRHHTFPAAGLGAGFPPSFHWRASRLERLSSSLPGPTRHHRLFCRGECFAGVARVLAGVGHNRQGIHAM